MPAKGNITAANTEKTMKTQTLLLIFVLLAMQFATVCYAQDSKKKLKIFILAGQSNMEGKGSVEVMQHQLKVPEKKDRFARYQKNGAWIERDDVFIHYLGGQGKRTGKLTVGYGVSKPDSRRLIGPELGFGWTVGDHFDEDVLIIKTAWGGKSIDRDFRPPSRGFPDSMKPEFEKRKERNGNLNFEDYKSSYGDFYRQMIQEVKTVTKDLQHYAPRYHDQGFEIAGFVWFQGWNDQYAPTSIPDYKDNLSALIKDVRKELGTPALPFVIGAMGHNGDAQDGKIKQIADAQMAAAELPEFKGNVLAIRTAKYWDTEAEAAYEKYWAKKEERDLEKWRQFGNDKVYHYFGSPVFFNLVGNAFGESMLQLLKTEKSKK